MFLLGFAGMVTLIGVAYAQTPVPKDVQTSAEKQQTSIYYSDGKTLIGTIGTPRVPVEYNQISPNMINAVVSIEDHDFWHESGVSPTGTARAVVSTLFGGQTQGGSTITQQLARNYYGGLSQQRSITRKFKEILISIRVGNEVDKKTIIQRYLNTIYLGRNAFGVQAASRAYFRTNSNQLTVAQAAMLAAMIQRPAYFKTQGNDQAAQDLKARWNTVLDDMVKYKFLSPEDRAKQVFPKTQTNWEEVSDTDQGGQNGYLKQRIENELNSKWGLSPQQVAQGGYKIITTYRAPLEKYTAQLVNDTKKKQHFDKSIQFGIAAVEPTTGEVWAAYGGPGYNTQQFDNSYQGEVQPGSSFKPYVLATALKQGYSLKTRVNGKYKQIINGTSFHNDSRSENGVFDLTTMTAKSINTAYVWLGQKVGLQNVVSTAEGAGIPSSAPELDATHTSLPLGTMLLKPIEQASGYTTFANGGLHIESHQIKQVLEPENGKPAVKAHPIPQWKRTQVVSSAQADDATYAMEQVVKHGTGTRAALPDGRDVAGKTGTTSEFKSAWFVGYTPQLSTAVALWKNKKGGGLDSLQSAGSQTYGGQIPADVFSEFMSHALDGTPKKTFNAPNFGGNVPDWSVSSPTPTTSTSPTTSSSPTTSTSTSTNRQACTPFNDPNCDPSKVPSKVWLNWWCSKYGNAQNSSACQTTSPTPSSSATKTHNPGGNGTGQSNRYAKLD